MQKVLSKVSVCYKHATDRQDLRGGMVGCGGTANMERYKKNKKKIHTLALAYRRMGGAKQAYRKR